jgi:hypothetical protein
MDLLAAELSSVQALLGRLVSIDPAGVVHRSQVLRAALVSRLLPCLAQLGLTLQQEWDSSLSRILTQSVHRCTIKSPFFAFESCVRIDVAPTERLHVYLNECVTDRVLALRLPGQTMQWSSSLEGLRVHVKTVDPGQIRGDSGFVSPHDSKLPGDMAGPLDTPAQHVGVASKVSGAHTAPMGKRRRGYRGLTVPFRRGKTFHAWLAARGQSLLPSFS